MPVSIGTTTVTALYLGTTSITSAYLGNTQVFGGSFTPLDLFSTGAQGIWLDPSDLTTMFSDRAGTIQVTTPGTVVGKRLDKSGRGNHATAPTDAARPTYGVEPKGGRRNLLTWSEDFGNAVWVMTSATVATNTLTAPDGTLTADTITRTTSGGLFAQTTTGLNTANLQLTLSFYVYPPAGVTSLTVRIDRVGIGQGNQTVKTVVPETWTRVTHSVTLDANTQSPVPRIDLTGGASLSIWGAQLETGSTATNYQRVLSAYDVTEAGVATVHYCQYDGSDDSMSTAAIDFTGTDKMSVFAGVRKLSDATDMVMAEFGVSYTSFAGWYLFNYTSGRFAYGGRGGRGGTVGDDATTSVTAAPSSAILTAQQSISGGVPSTMRRNGVLEGSSANTTFGGGNFGNYSLFIGRRNNATLPFNGKDYGIIIVGKAASAGEITDTEAWLSAKTSGVTI